MHGTDLPRDAVDSPRRAARAHVLISQETLKDCGRDEREDDDLEPAQWKTGVVAGGHYDERITPGSDKPRAVHLH
jgi:hypothetical protein